MNILESVEIITVRKLLRNDRLNIPLYQRPYKWTPKNVNQLINDIIFHKDKKTYRLGTLVIHKESEEILNIVDGQQRTITLILIAFAIEQIKQTVLEPKLLQLSFQDDISKANIQKNYKEIKKRINDFNDEIVNFFLKCELVQVTLNNVSVAFQFFDSQNARGKDLEPHDLLKAFHLREMDTVDSSINEEKKRIVKNWEDMKSEELSKLFAFYLYRIKNWSKGNSAKYFTKDDIGDFKGISITDEEYEFSKIFRRANESSSNDYPFQIDQTIINGKRFFQMVELYEKMIKNIKFKDNYILKTIKEYRGWNRRGDTYVRYLFYCGLIYYIDKFGDANLNQAIEKIFIWAYSLRLKQQVVYIGSIDNYALGKENSKALSNIKLFKKIRDAIHPNDILHMELDEIKKVTYDISEIVDIFVKLGYHSRSNSSEGTTEQWFKRQNERRHACYDMIKEMRNCFLLFKADEERIVNYEYVQYSKAGKLVGEINVSNSKRLDIILKTKIDELPMPKPLPDNIIDEGAIWKQKKGAWKQGRIKFIINNSSPKQFINDVKEYIKIVAEKE
ncbi:MAG: DUF262 domain-containing protein [Fibromonadales bacterium]|nr:DUF262 domain-containing protein [Fibromonadales bacterium]